MGMIKIEMYGSFPQKNFQTCAEDGGHVQALKRSLDFLVTQLGPAVVKDAQLTVEGIAPPNAPLGQDSP